MLLRTLLLGLLCSITFSLSASPEDCNEVSISIQAPPDMVISCCYWFSYGMLLDPSNNAFGRIVYDRSQIKKVKTHDKVCEAWCNRDPHTKYDPLDVQDGKPCELYNQYYSAAHPNQAHGLVWGWDGYVTNAPGPVQIDIDDRRGCGTGLVIRRISVEEHGVRYYDDQKIWIVDCQPFYVNPDNCFDPDDDIEWPNFCQQPQPLDGCDADLSPDNPLLGRARVVNAGDDQCNLISVDYEDDIITIEENACLKVLRVWTVIDWCQYHPLKNPYEGRWEYLQVIKVRDKEDPVMSCTIGDCTPSEKDSTGVCFGEIFLRATATDSCTDQSHLRYEYKIDLDNDGNGHDFDLFSGPLTKLDVAPIDMDNPYATHQDSVNNASGKYPLGTHRIMWFVEDGCGNVALCDTTFEIKDCKEPTPYCKTGIITVLMPATKEIEVWAKDLDDGSFDNCTDQENLVFSFSEDVTDQNKVFTCSELDTNVVRIYVTDEEGNQDYCETIIVIQDSQNNCGGNVQTQASGIVYKSLAGIKPTLDDADIILYEDNVEVQRVANSSSLYDLDLTGYSGDLSILPEKNNQFVQGVGIADMIWLQRFLLGRKDLSATQKVAADVNNDCNITAADISAMRKVILGIDKDFDHYNQTSWVFQPLGSPDLDTNDLCKSKGPHSIVNNLPSYDFLAIKVGDISGSAHFRGNGVNKSRSTTAFMVQNGDEKGEFILTATEDITVNALYLEWPYAIDYANSDVFNGLDWHNSTLSASKMIANSEVNVKISSGQALLTLKFKEEVGLNSLTADQIHMVDESLLETTASLRIKGDVSKKRGFNIEVYPSPAKDFLYVKCGNEIAKIVNYEVIDINGRLVQAKSYLKIEAKNRLKIDLSSVPQGAYLLRVNTENGSSTIRWLKD